MNRGKAIYFNSILIFITFLFSLELKAQESQEKFYSSIIINLVDNNWILVPLNDSFELENLGEEIKFVLMGQVEYLPISEISSLGYVYYNSDSNIIDLFEKDFDKDWLIFNTQGILLFRQRSKKPDLSSLRKGEIFIIKCGDNTFKYMPW